MLKSALFRVESLRVRVGVRDFVFLRGPFLGAGLSDYVKGVEFTVCCAWCRALWRGVVGLWFYGLRHKVLAVLEVFRAAGWPMNLSAQRPNLAAPNRPHIYIYKNIYIYMHIIYINFIYMQSMCVYRKQAI